MTKKKGYFIASTLTLLTLSILIVIEFFVYQHVLNKKKEQFGEIVMPIEERIQGAIENNLYILKGFSAYVQTTEHFDEAHVYEYLGHLLKDENTFIKNIGILEDTTIIWNYPPDENQEAIGVDLSLIPDQRSSVLEVKEKGITQLVGPVQLVQGGMGYIIRMPLIKDEKNFGQISIVIDGEAFTNYLYQTQEDFHVVFMITNNDQLIFNPDYIIKKDDIIHNIHTDLFNWTMYLRPSKGWTIGSHWFTTIPFGFIITSIWVGIHFYHKHVEDRKNQREVHHDRLTGLFNRYYLYKYAESLFNIARINQYKVGILLLDIQDFKDINDEHGLKIGDQILIELSLLLKNELRKGQEVFRIGGNEFIILFENVQNHTLLLDIQNRLKETIESKAILEDQNLFLRITIGSSLYPDDGEDLDTLYSTADRNMYHE